MNRLAESFINYHSKSFLDPRKWFLADALNDCDELYEATDDDPLKAWEVILEIVNNTSSNRVIEALALVPVENLLTENGLQIIELVEKETYKNPNVKELLLKVSKGYMQEKIWHRLINACGILEEEIKSNILEWRKDGGLTKLGKEERERLEKDFSESDVRNRFINAFLPDDGCRFSRSGTDFLWASHEIEPLANVMPNLLWELILEIINKHPEPKVAEIVGDELLYYLMLVNGSLLIDKVENESKSSDQIKICLMRVIPIGIDEKIWNRIETINS